MSFPFDRPVIEQLDALALGVEALEEFFEQHPNLPHPWSLSAMGPTCYFHSAAADALRKEFGREGWTQERMLVWREENGVRIEMQLPQQQPQPFVL